MVCKLHQELSGHVVGVVHLSGGLLLAVEVDLKNHAGDVLPIGVSGLERPDFDILEENNPYLKVQ